MKLMGIMPYKKMKRKVYADEYLNHQKEYDQSCDYIDNEPVDMNSGFVAVKKNAPDNLKKTEENIRDRFSLDTDEGGES